MLSARSLFQEILDNDESFRLFCSIAASGEAQGGWENSRIAALVPESQRELTPKIVRHGADEDKHGRIFTALMRKRGLDPTPVPEDTDYTMLLEKQGIGLAHEKLRADQPLTDRDIVCYLAHSRVTEQRASEQMQLLHKHFADHPDLARAIKMISNDEDNHLAYCHEELLRLAAEGHGRAIQRILKESARAEIRVYHDVSLAVMAHMGRILGWSRTKAGVLAAGIRAVYVYERIAGWRRMVSLAALRGGGAAHRYRYRRRLLRPAVDVGWVLPADRPGAARLYAAPGASAAASRTTPRCGVDPGPARGRRLVGGYPAAVGIFPDRPASARLLA